MLNYFKQKQLRQLFIVHSKELLREPAVLFWGFVFPILMALGLGIAFTNQPDVVIDTAVILPGESQVPVSSDSNKVEQFLSKFTEAIPGNKDGIQLQRLVIKNEKLGNTTFLFRRCSWEEGMSLLKKGKLNILIEATDERINYHFDPLNPEAQSSYFKLSTLLNSKQIVKNQLSPDIKTLTLSGSRYVDFLVPGLIALGVMMSCMWGLSYGMIEKRSQKLLRRMVATPMNKSFFLIALITVRTVLNVCESATLFLAAWLVFDINIQGSVFALLLIFVAGNIAFAGIAIFASSHTAKTEVGNGLINLVVTPMMVLSGIFFSYHNFPDWLIRIIEKLPLTILADSIRSIFIEGAGLADMLIPVFILLITGILFFSVGLKIFKWH